MNILYLGDIMGPAGIRVVGQILPGLKRRHDIELVIAQGENVSDGRGLLPADIKTLQAAGVDFFTGGNWTLYRRELHSLLGDPAAPVVRPANYPAGTPGLDHKIIRLANRSILIFSLLGQIVGRDADQALDNPLRRADEILAATTSAEPRLTVVNFHGDFSSQKRIIGYYLDGRVTAVIGDHWHVPTADAMVLPKGTAHITDVGMCGSLHSSLGLKLDPLIDRWRDGQRNLNQLEERGPLQFNAVLIDASPVSGLAQDIKRIQLGTSGD